MSFMQLHLEKPDNRHAIQSCGSEGIRINDRCYRHSLIVSAGLLEPDWPVRHISELDLDALRQAIGQQPDILLIGTGQRQHTPVLPLMQELLRNNIAAEFMHTTAACRTFNILLAEQRRVMAALIWDQDFEQGSRNHFPG